MRYRSKYGSRRSFLMSVLGNSPCFCPLKLIMIGLDGSVYFVIRLRLLSPWADRTHQLISTVPSRNVRLADLRYSVMGRLCVSVTSVREDSSSRADASPRVRSR